MGESKVDKSLILPTISKKNRIILRKNLVIAMAKPRARRKTAPVQGQEMLLEALAMAFGGYVKFAAYCTRKLKISRATQRSAMVNWKVRNGVPIKNVPMYAEALGVSPYVLNYKEVCAQRPMAKHPTWREVVDALTFIPLDLRAKIAQTVPYVGYVS